MKSDAGANEQSITGNSVALSKSEIVTSVPVVELNALCLFLWWTTEVEVGWTVS
jgi:hypothetical protein